MDRRQFLKTASAVGLSTAVPIPVTIAAPTPAFASASAEAMSYKWAEMIVRAHNKCSVPMLQRLLKISGSQAGRIQTLLLENGVLGSRNAYGFYQASKPLYQELFPKPVSVADHLSNKLQEVVKNRNTDDADEMVTGTTETDAMEIEAEPADDQEALNKPEEDTSDAKTIERNAPAPNRAT